MRGSDFLDLGLNILVVLRALLTEHHATGCDAKLVRRYF
jgi:hypothetical protein